MVIVASAAVGAPGRAIKGASSFGQTSQRPASVGARSESVQHRFNAARAYAVHGAATIRLGAWRTAAIQRCAVERAINVYKAADRRRSVGTAGEAIDHLLRAAPRYAENGSAARIWRAAGIAAFGRRAKERATNA